MIITCAALECVQKFTIDGVYLKGAGKPGKGEFELQGPNGVAIGKDGKIYVCDLGNKKDSNSQWRLGISWELQSHRSGVWFRMFRSSKWYRYKQRGKHFL